MLPDNFHEIDFLPVETSKSGDAITVRYSISGNISIHVVDGGFTDMGEKIVAHISEYYDQTQKIDHVVLTHPDGDHARGLKHVLQECKVGTLWMNRPWLYADELLPRFKRFKSADSLSARLRECYPNVAALEDIANEHGITILEAFQGNSIGAFTVMSPTKEMFLDLITSSDKTPNANALTEDEDRQLSEQSSTLRNLLKKAIAFIVSHWGEEKFSTSATSRENEMSIVQFAHLNGKNILLTGDAGREALQQVIAYAPAVDLILPGLDLFQVPHHGSRRNVSTDTLDQILGPRLPQGCEKTFTAVISSAAADKDHPRKSVVRAMIHRGGVVHETEGKTIQHHQNAPPREGFGPAQPMAYPTEQEE